jgi:hypothetical protein
MTSLGQRNRHVWMGLIALGLLCLLVVIFAPSNGLKTSGSTYSRAPEGYLGWYTYMQSQGTPVQRWQRPVGELRPQTGEGPQTLLRIYSDLVSEDLALAPAWVDDWLNAGNQLVLLGVRRSVTEAHFTTQLNSPQGPVTVITRRRDTDRRDLQLTLLGDDYGAVVWQDFPKQNLSKQDSPDFGRLVLASTQHLAANAYQANPNSPNPNYAFLAELLTHPEGPIWVDEFLHGYKDTDVILADTIGNWSEYLSKTPVAVGVMQLSLIVGVFILAQNRRLGTRTLVKTPVVDNSQAYIDALAAVLYKAGSATFVVEAIAKAERLNLQKALGLGPSNVEDSTLKQAWSQHTGQNVELLTPLLQPPLAGTVAPDRQLRQWLAALYQIRQQIKHDDPSAKSTYPKPS